MSTNPVRNDLGGKYFTRRGDLRRASRTEVTYRGIDLVVEYIPHGFTDDAYVEKITSIEINHIECLALFDEEQIADLCERIEQSWDIERDEV